MSTFADTHYVNVGNATPAHPYTSWETAATVLQEAVNAARAGDTVLVTNGVYETGGCYVPHYLTVVVPDYLLENGVKE